VLAPLSRSKNLSAGSAQSKTRLINRRFRVSQLSFSTHHHPHSWPRADPHSVEHWQTSTDPTFSLTSITVLTMGSKGADDEVHHHLRTHRRAWLHSVHLTLEKLGEKIESHSTSSTTLLACRDVRFSDSTASTALSFGTCQIIDGQARSQTIISQAVYFRPLLTLTFPTRVPGAHGLHNSLS
jgi:hypothetical protein